MEVDGSRTLRIIRLMPETPVKRARLNALARKRLTAMAVQTGFSETKLLEMAITELRVKLLKGEGVRVTIPDEPDDPPTTARSGHKKARRAA